ncbi:slr1658 superfamily regulator [Laspinema olomoucense]|uniref:slr1658 superfamily regulator n=1 Tax=Laspinema olomoucense TaxID=3231600 RepID=UPI0021BB60DB|nr:MULTISPECIES: ATP-binding protein [unclassified Laspinema]MCT7970958.1 ATP-binding protein [Laspinema sp. D3d]MCT7995727.1 ATP-binding protein [Laspinema sp. D3c]
MIEIFGDFIQNPPLGTEYLILGFSPSSASIKTRWRNNGLSADFVANYLSTFFGDSENQQNPGHKKAESAEIVNYIANELLENAMKFSDSTLPHPTTLEIHLYEDSIILMTKNGINAKQDAELRAFIERLTVSEPEELYLEQLEKNAETDNHSNSRVGYLTIINDYQGKIGWQFERTPEESPGISLTTMVTLLL